MPKPAPLTNPARTLAHRFTGLGDRLRQFNTKFGLRPMRVFLVWTQFDGEERGEGEETEAARCELLPTPKVTGWSTIVRRPYAQGVFPEGTVFVDEVSAGAYTFDMLSGLVVPSQATMAPTALKKLVVSQAEGERTTDPRVDFFYELFEDARGELTPQRFRFRLLGEPERDAANLAWKFALQRADEARTRAGESRIGQNPEDRLEDLVKGFT